MTMELLERIIEENNIPKDVHFMSDSGWECDPTEMNGVFYNRQCNTIIFTQSGMSDREYEASEDWEILYDPDLIKVEGLEVYPVTSVASGRITEDFKKAIKEAGDFELYYGIQETEDKYDEIDFNWRPLFYSIQIKAKNIGYIGFHGGDSGLEPEIYIFKPYRNKGYGTCVLKRFVDIAFKEGLVKKWREKTENPPPLYAFKKETVFPEQLVSTVRVENEYSRKMMLKCGFRENKEPEALFRFFIDENGSEAGSVEVSKFVITKQDYIKKTQNTIL